MQLFCYQSHTNAALKAINPFFILPFFYFHRHANYRAAAAVIPVFPLHW
jgi:hypothetical protein